MGLLDDRVAVVTGASRGIGAATALALDAAGARVALVARSGEALRSLAGQCRNDALILPTDLEHSTSPRRIVDEVLRRFGRIDVLVNNAAMVRRSEVAEIDVEVLNRSYATNVRAPLLMVSSAAPSMMARRAGSIINLSSISGLLGAPRRSVYAATKGALDAATRALASELGPHGIRVNSIAPGVVDTDLWSSRKARAGVVEHVQRLTPLQRWAEPADIADVAVFLASDASRFITGETISVDGGMANSIDLFGTD